MYTVSRPAPMAACTLALLAGIAAPVASASTFAAAATAQLSLVSVTGSSLDGLTIVGSDVTDQSTARTGFADSSGDAFVGYLADPLGIGLGFDLVDRSGR